MGRGEQLREVQAIGLPMRKRTVSFKHIDPTDHFGDRTEAELRHDASGIVGNLAGDVGVNDRELPDTKFVGGMKAPESGTIPITSMSCESWANSVEVLTS